MIAESALRPCPPRAIVVTAFIDMQTIDRPCHEHGAQRL